VRPRRILRKQNNSKLGQGKSTALLSTFRNVFSAFGPNVTLAFTSRWGGGRKRVESGKSIDISRK